MKQFAVLVFLLVVPFAQLEAQPPGPPDQRSFERVEQWKKLRMIEMLDLSEDQSVRFVARLNEHDRQRREMMNRKSEALDKIERLVRQEADSKEYGKAFDEIRDIDGKMAEQHRAWFDGLKDILSDEQRGKLLLFDRHFERQLREAMRQYQRRHRSEEGQ